MKRALATSGAIVTAAVLLTACGSATQDRTSGSGKSPDSTEDTWNVKVFNNADNVPNFAISCINRKNPIAVLSTLSGGDSGKDKSSTFVLLPDLDVSYCGGTAR